MLPSATRFFGVEKSSLRLFKQAFRLPAGQPLVDHFHGHAELLLNAPGKTLGSFRHFAACAIEFEWQSHDNLRYPAVAHEFAETPHVFVAVDSLQGGQRLRNLGLRVRDCQAHPRSSVIDRENRMPDAGLRTGSVVSNSYWMHRLQYNLRARPEPKPRASWVRWQHRT